MNRAASLVILVLLAACSRASSGGFVPGPSQDPGFSPRLGMLAVRVSLPLETRRRRSPFYLSPATQALSVAIDGPTKIVKVVGLTVRSSGCRSTLMTQQCTLDVPLKACPSTKRCYTATVATYDALRGGKIPKSAHRLSADQNVSFTIGTGTTIVPLVLYGIPRTIVANSAARSTLLGNQRSGFVIPKCGPATQGLEIFAADADGNLIVGPGAPAIVAKSSNPAQISVFGGTAAKPNAFVLGLPKAPKYPFGNQRVPLAVTATPAAASGAPKLSAKLKVAYSGDICGVFSEFDTATANALPFGIARGPDGAMWFTELNVSKIGRITTTGTISEHALASGSDAEAVVTGPDNNLWLTENGTNNIAKMSTTGAVTEYPTPTVNSRPQMIAVGPDGNLWFTEAIGNVAKITTTGVVTEYATPTSGSDPYGIMSGPNGSLWFTELQASRIGSITTGGAIQEFPTIGANSSPVAIVQGADGQLWFTECQAGGNIGHATTSPAGTQVNAQYALPESGSEPSFATLGPDGAVWFSESAGNRIGSIATDGTIREYAVPTAGAEPFGIALGPDGALWFAEAFSSKIGRIW